VVVVPGRLLGVEIEAYKAPQVRVVARVGRSKPGGCSLDADAAYAQLPHFGPGNAGP